jgi:hypothetical protein
LLIPWDAFENYWQNRIFGFVNSSGMIVCQAAERDASAAVLDFVEEGFFFERYGRKVMLNWSFPQAP